MAVQRHQSGISMLDREKDKQRWTPVLRHGFKRSSKDKQEVVHSKHSLLVTYDRLIILDDLQKDRNKETNVHEWRRIFFVAAEVRVSRYSVFFWFSLLAFELWFKYLPRCNDRWGNFRWSTIIEHVLILRWNVSIKVIDVVLRWLG